MLALYRSGRRAEALAAYLAARNELVEQLGIEPGTRLRELHQAILVHGPSIDAPLSMAHVRSRPLESAHAAEADFADASANASASSSRP